MVADAQFHVPDKVDDARFMLSALPDLNLASDVVEAVLLGSDGLGDAPISPLLSSTIADAQFHVPDKIEDARFMLSALPYLNPASDVVEAVLLGSDVTDEAKTKPACTTDTDSEEGLVRDLRLTLQEHFGNIVKKWRNSEQWVLELRDGRRVAVPIQISLPRCEAIEVLEEHKLLALVPWESSELLMCQWLLSKRRKCWWRTGFQIPTRRMLISL